MVVKVTASVSWITSIFLWTKLLCLFFMTPTPPLPQSYIFEKNNVSKAEGERVGKPWQQSWPQGSRHVAAAHLMLDRSADEFINNKHMMPQIRVWEWINKYPVSSMKWTTEWMKDQNAVCSDTINQKKGSVCVFERVLNLVPQNKCPQLVWTGKLAVCRQTGQCQSRLVEAHGCVDSWRDKRKRKKKKKEMWSREMVLTNLKKS